MFPTEGESPMFAEIFDSVPLFWRRMIVLAFYLLAASSAGYAFFMDTPLDMAKMLWIAIAIAGFAMFLHINIRTGVLAEWAAPRASMIRIYIFVLGLIGLFVSVFRFEIPAL